MTFESLIRAKKSICVVASTLPTAFIASQVDVLSIDKIIVMNRDLELSYQILKKKFPTIKIVRAPRNYLVRDLFFLSELIRSRLTGCMVIFFHECCLTSFDLLLMLIKPNGYYFPQVTMYGFKEISYAHFPKQKISTFLRTLGLVNRFRFYMCPPIGSGPAEYVISSKEYPKSIKCMDVSYSRTIVAAETEILHDDSKDLLILFIIGKSFVDDKTQTRYFSSLIDVAYSNGYACHIKDHPNPIYRLNLMSNKAITLDPLIPSELLDFNYKYIVGLSSSALLSYGDRAFSLLDMIKEINSSDRELLFDHFEKASPGNSIKYPKSIEEFEVYL